MKGTAPTILVLFMAVLIAAGCIAEKKGKKILKKTDSSLVRKRTMIEPSRAYEECIELQHGQKMRYSFRTSGPVDFNIHYHGEDTVHYPVSRNDITSWRGTLNVNEQEYYTDEQEYFCLMWENHNYKRVRLEFDCSLVQ